MNYDRIGRTLSNVKQNVLCVVSVLTVRHLIDFGLYQNDQSVTQVT